jgi:outer membrane receptor protein involved in Fe transport
MSSMRISLALCTAGLLAAPPLACAEPSPSNGIVEQPLAQALSEFAAETGLQVVYVSESVGLLRSKAVPGGMPPGDTLARMLRGTGLRYEFLNAWTVRIFGPDEHGPASPPGGAPTGLARAPPRMAGQSARLDAIIVTATHQTERASELPLSLAVWSQEEMRLSGVKGIDEISALTPGLSFDWRSNIGAGVYTNLDMRGVTGTHGVSTGVFIDDTAMPAAWHDSYRRAFPATFDLERVEVLRGAQGMLLGRGTLGGAIRFITTPPDVSASSGHATAEVSTTRYGAPSYEAGAAAGVPLVDDVLGIRVSGWYRSDGGFVDRADPLTNEVVDHDVDGMTSGSARVGLAWMPAAATRITSMVTYDSNRASDSSSFFVRQSSPAQGRFRNSYVIRQPREDHFYLATLRVEHESGTARFLAASSYLDRENQSIHDLNCFGDCGIPVFAFALEGRQRTIQQELRLASADAEGKFSWLLGAHLSRTESRGRLGDATVPRAGREGTRIDETQSEVYLDLSRTFGSRVSASAGARFAHSSYDYASLPSPRFRGGDDESLVAPRFGLSYRTAKESLLYLSAAKGYGGHGIVPLIPGCEPLELLSDSVWNYEAGAKTDLLGGRAHMEASLFDTRWNNHQSETVVFACLAGFQKGQAESNGFELSGQALVGERTTIGLEISYIDARYTHSVESNGVVIVRAGDAVHNGRLPWSLSAFFDHEFPPIFDTIVNVHVEHHHHGGNSRRRLEDNPDSPFYQAFGNADSTTNILNLRASANIGAADIAVFVNNALDSSPALNRFPGCCSGDFLPTAYTLTPRTVGVSAHWRF